MNNAETNIVTNALTGALAEITRIGGGEVRVNRALDAPVAARDDDAPTGALGFGFVDVTGTVSLKKTVTHPKLRRQETHLHDHAVIPLRQRPGERSGHDCGTRERQGEVGTAATRCSTSR